MISEDMDEPRSLVLDLVRGRMFWSDWGRRPRIERAWMDGREREVTDSKAKRDCYVFGFAKFSLHSV